MIDSDIVGIIHTTLLDVEILILCVVLIQIYITEHSKLWFRYFKC